MGFIDTVCTLCESYDKLKELHTAVSSDTLAPNAKYLTAIIAFAQMP